MFKIKDFLGREEISAILKKRVNGLSEGYRQNVALIGPELIGKTSIILNLFQNLDKSKFILLYVDAKPGQFSHFIYKFVASLLYNFSQNEEIGKDADLPALIENARPFIPKTIENLKKMQAELAKRKFNSAYLKLLESVELLGKETKKPVIFSIDEFHYLEKIKLKNIFAELGKKIMVQKNIMYILLSSSEARAKKILGEKLSLLFGNFETIEVGALDRLASFNFINQRLKGISLSDEVQSFIISFTNGSPFYLDIVCSEFFDVYLNNSKIPYDSLELLATAFRNLLFDQHGVLSQYFSNFLMKISHKPSGTRLISTLLVIANRHTRLADISKLVHASNKDTQQKLEKLIEANLVYKNGLFYQIIDPVFAFWLKYVYQKRITDTRWDFHQKENEFKADLLGFIRELEQLNQRPMQDKFKELFGGFNNELVQVDEKKLRLPHFETLEVLSDDERKLTLLAKGGRSNWLVLVNKAYTTENDAVEFVNRSKQYSRQLQKKVIIDLEGIDINARLLAKENKIAIWSEAAVKNLFEVFNQQRGIFLSEDISNI